MQISPMKTRPPQSGFTLLELLAGIAILAVLSALLLPAVGKIRNSTDRTKCVSNLRTLGIAINLYATDNDDRLPGPCPTGLGRTLVDNQRTQMIYHLQPYLDLPTPTASPVYPEILHCPSLRNVSFGTPMKWQDITLYAAYSNVDLPADKRYLKDRQIVDDNGTSWPVGPWGRSNSTPGYPGWKRITISSQIDETKTLPGGGKPTLATIPAIREIDASLKTWPWPTPPKAVHGAFHNVLFFDWHVESVPVTAYQ